MGTVYKGARVSFILLKQIILNNGHAMCVEMESNRKADTNTMASLK